MRSMFWLDLQPRLRHSSKGDWLGSQAGLVSRVLKLCGDLYKNMIWRGIARNACSSRTSYLQWFDELRKTFNRDLKVGGPVAAQKRRDVSPQHKVALKRVAFLSFADIDEVDLKTGCLLADIRFQRTTARRLPLICRPVDCWRHAHDHWRWRVPPPASFIDEQKMHRLQWEVHSE